MHSGLRSVVLVFALMGFVVGLTACAKYPVVSDSRGSAPTAAAPEAAPMR